MEATTSVVVRTRDRPILLRRALGSVLAQTYHDLQVVVVNDGGDRAVVDEVLASVMGDDPRLVRVHNETTQGRAEAFNAGLAASRGAYVAVHDDDDTWEPAFLQATVAHLQAHAAHCAVGTRCWVVKETLFDGSIIEDHREPFAVDSAHATLTEMVWGNYMPPISMLFRRSALDEVGGFDPSLPVLEDWDLNLRLLARHTMGFLPEVPLASWHHRTDEGGAASNSIVAEARDHVAYDLLIRDQYLRGTRGSDVPQLGALLASCYHLKRVATSASTARDEENRVFDAWTRTQRDHLESTVTAVRVELGRLRGDTMLVTERISHAHDDLQHLGEAMVPAVTEAVRDLIKPLRKKLGLVGRQVEDLWRTNKSVDRLRRQRGAR